MSRILVTGASGLLGIHFGLQYAAEHEIIGVAHTHRLKDLPFALHCLDLAQAGAADKLVAETHPELILHCAALANVDQAESNPALAQRINAEVPGELAAAARRTGAVMVQISTDAVFDGTRGDYRETDEPNPINVYAHSKLAGEAAVLAANPEAIVARVNFYGWSLGGQRSLGELFYNQLSAGRKMFGFTDVFFCPLQVNVLGSLLLKMAQRGLSGIYHVVSSEALSKYDFGCRIARRFGLDESLIQPVSWVEAGLKAARSPRLTLRTDKLAAVLGEPLPGQAGSLDTFFAQFQTGLHNRIRQFAV
jgi:dTDP-4-dehydrorhamnose reductase